MLAYGCTRLEIGVQSVYEDVARDTNRGEYYTSFWKIAKQSSASCTFLLLDCMILLLLSVRFIALTLSVRKIQNVPKISLKYTDTLPHNPISNNIPLCNEPIKLHIQLTFHNCRSHSSSQLRIVPHVQGRWV